MDVLEVKLNVIKCFSKQSTKDPTYLCISFVLFKLFI